MMLKDWISETLKVTWIAASSCNSTLSALALGSQWVPRASSHRHGSPHAW